MYVCLDDDSQLYYPTGQNYSLELLFAKVATAKNCEELDLLTFSSSSAICLTERRVVMYIHIHLWTTYMFGHEFLCKWKSMVWVMGSGFREEWRFGSLQHEEREYCKKLSLTIKNSEYHMKNTPIFIQLWRHAWIHVLVVDSHVRTHVCPDKNPIYWTCYWKPHG